MAHIIDFEHGISAVDGEYDRPLQTSVHLVVEEGRAAIIDPCVNRSVPRILEALAAKGLEPADVQWVILTHIHLDHAGGTGD